MMKTWLLLGHLGLAKVVLDSIYSSNQYKVDNLWHCVSSTIRIFSFAKKLIAGECAESYLWLNQEKILYLYDCGKHDTAPSR